MNFSGLDTQAFGRDLFNILALYLQLITTFESILFVLGKFALAHDEKKVYIIDIVT